MDDTFANFKTVMAAVFGKWVTIQNRGGQTIYNGYSGLCNKYRENKIKRQFVKRDCVL